MTTNPFAALFEKSITEGHPGRPVDDVCILWQTDAVTTARVRDAGGIYDVHRSHLAGWSCSCPDEERCAHILAVQQLVSEGPRR